MRSCRRRRRARTKPSIGRREGESIALRDVIALFKINVQGLNELEETDRRLRKVRQEAEQAERSLLGFGKALIVGAVARGLKGFIEGQIQMADELKHNAENLGLTTDELQKYQYVASVMQVPTQQAVVAFRFFNRAIGEVAMGTKSTTKYFQQMGIQIYDANGKIKPTDQLLLEFSDKLAATPEHALRTAYAMRALGRGGAAMLPVLQKGSGALRQMFKDIEELGGGFDEDFIEKAHEVDAESKLLAMGWRTMSAMLIKELIPYIKLWIEHGIKNVKMLIDTAKHTTIVASAIRFLAGIAVAAAIAVGIAWAPEVLVFTELAAAVWYAYVIFDDFYGFLNGKKSTIGDSIGKMGGSSQTVAKQIKDAFKGVKDALQPVIDSFASMDGNAASTIAHMIKLASVIGTTLYGALDTATTGALQLGYAIAGITPGSGVSLNQAGAKVLSLGDAWQARAAAFRKFNGALDQLGHPDKAPPAAPDPHVLDAADLEFMKTHPDYVRVNGHFQKKTGVNADGTLAGLAPPPAPGQGANEPSLMGLPLPPPNITVVVNANSSDLHAVGRAAAKGTAGAMRDAYAGVTTGMPSAVGSN